MRRFFTLLVAATTATLSVVGCGSEDDSAAPGNTGGGAGAPAAAQCKGDYAALTKEQLDAAVDSSGKCGGDDDRAVVCANDTTRKVTICGSDCFMTGGSTEVQDACVASCVERTTSPSLSAGCIDCYVADIACTRTNCPIVCGASPTSVGCAACRVQFGCAPDFFACSGLPGPDDLSGAAGAGN